VPTDSRAGGLDVDGTGTSDMAFDAFEAGAEVHAEPERYSAGQAALDDQLQYEQELGEIQHWFKACGRAERFASLESGSRQRILDAIGRAFDSQVGIELSELQTASSSHDDTGGQLNATPTMTTPAGSEPNSAGPSTSRASDAEGGNSRPGGGEGDVEASQTHFKPRMLGELKGAGCNGSEFGASGSLLSPIGSGTFSTFGSFNSQDRKHKEPHGKREALSPKSSMEAMQRAEQGPTGDCSQERRASGASFCSVGSGGSGGFGKVIGHVPSVPKWPSSNSDGSFPGLQESSFASLAGIDLPEVFRDGDADTATQSDSLGKEFDMTVDDMMNRVSSVW